MQRCSSKTRRISVPFVGALPVISAATRYDEAVRAKVEERTMDSIDRLVDHID